MESFSQKDHLLEVVLSLVGLALIWLSIPHSYPFTYTPYLLLLFLPGYALISVIKPDNSFVTKMIIGILLSLLFLLFLPITFQYLNLTFLDGLTATLLFLTTILFSLIAILSSRRQKSNINMLEDFQQTENPIKQLKKIKKKTTLENILAEETGTYFPLTQPEDHLKNRMSIKLIYDTIIDNPKPKEEEITKDQKTTKKILHPKVEKKTTEKIIPQPTNHIKNETPNLFPNEITTPPKIQSINNNQTGFKNWDLLLALLLSGLTISFSYYLPLATSLQNTITYYFIMLFILTYTFLIVLIPNRKRIGLLSRFLTSLPYAILLLVLVLIYRNSKIITSLHFPLIMLFALATFILVMAAILRRKSITPTN